MTSIVEILSPENPVFATYGFWSAVLVLKVLAMAMITSKTRRKKKAVTNPEDLVFLRDDSAKPVENDPDVERVRRAHLNDLENCVPFLIISFIYMLTNPSAWIACNLIRISVIGRIVHSYAYINAMQPYRAYGFAIGYLSMIFMCIQIMWYFL